MESSSSDLIFQVSDWDFYHNDDNKYTVRAYGTTVDEKKIFVEVQDFTPYFYVEIPKIWMPHQITSFIELIQKKIAIKYDEETKDTLIDHTTIFKHKFAEFTNYKKFRFLRLVFNNYDGFRAYERILNWKLYEPSLARKAKKYKLFESNIEPMIRMMHIRKLQACGWIRIKAEKYELFDEDDNPSNNDISVHTKWTNLEYYDSKDISKFIIAAFDIECYSADDSFPQIERDSDKIVQIGTTLNRYGEKECFQKYIVTLGSCDPIEGVIVQSYETEKEVLLAWRDIIIKENPDIVTGYNTFGFDYRYIYGRAKKLGIANELSKLGRIADQMSPFIEKNLSSSALGDNLLRYYGMHGRVQVDLFKVIQRDHNLQSYKLDNVASTFIRETVKDLRVLKKKKKSIIYTGTTYGLEVDRYVTLNYNDGLTDNSFDDGKKYRITRLGTKTIDGKKYNTIVVDGVIHESIFEVMAEKENKVFWCQVKDDMTPQDMFRLQRGTSADRAQLARYCIQDCLLCNKLLEKLQIITNNIGMSNVTSVPLSYIFLRGQGIKAFSLISKKCRERDHLVPVHKKKYVPKNPDGTVAQFKKSFADSEDSEEDEDDDGYEGAVVLDPSPPGYYEQPITVLDFSALYPKCMIEVNLSHECLVRSSEYDNLPNIKYKEVTFFNLDGTPNTCRYAQKKIGILPEILQDLLKARSDTRAMIKLTDDPFKKQILDGLQLAYKITANSIYGYTGAKTSAIYKRDIAASTTATGRARLMKAIVVSEDILPLLVTPILDDDWETYYDRINELFDTNALGGHDMFPGSPARIEDSKREEFIKELYTKFKSILKNKTIDPKCVYGDTDSVFVNFNIADAKTGKKLTDHQTLKDSINIGVMLGQISNVVFPYPHDLEYEKTFWPFIIHTKKRYVGNLYEFDPDKFYQKSMGIVLKRRDNAPIVKVIVGGIVKKLLNDRSPKKAITFAITEMKNMLSGKYPIEKFVVTKTIKANYKDRTSIGHVVLADRMAKRSGNKPQSNDRIPYVAIITKGKVKLQGDRIEHPDFIIENNLPIDYLFYITNQIMKPALQFLEHVVVNPQKIFTNLINRELNRRAGKKPLSFYTSINNKLTGPVYDEKTKDSICLDEVTPEVEESPNVKKCANKRKKKKKLRIL